MRKIILTLAIVLIVCMASVIALTACNIELQEMDGNGYYVSTEKDYSVEMISDFFAEMLKNPDFFVNCTDKNGKLQYIETVKGSAAYTLYKNGSQAYAFKKGGYFYTAFISTDGEGAEERTYYCSDNTKKGYYENGSGAMEEMYKQNYCSFMNESIGAGIVKGLPEEGATFYCKKTVETVSGFSNSSLEFSYVSDQITVTIAATAEEDKVNEVRIAISGEGRLNSDLTWTFAYGGASITLPDVDAWDGEVAE